MRGALTDHRRRDTRPIAELGLLVVATDRVTSGWTGVSQRSFVAYPRPENERTAVMLEDWCRNRGDLTRVRVNLELPRMNDGDHTAIYDVPEFILNRSFR